VKRLSASTVRALLPRFGTQLGQADLRRLDSLFGTLDARLPHLLADRLGDLVHVV